jgi:hypothetical protein
MLPARSAVNGHADDSSQVDRSSRYSPIPSLDPWRGMDPQLATLLRWPFEARPVSYTAAVMRPAKRDRAITPAWFLRISAHADELRRHLDPEEGTRD